MPTKNRRFKTVEEYINSFPKDVRTLLQEVRQTIRLAAPEAEEIISYQIPTFTLGGTAIVHYAAFKNHIGFFPPAPAAFKQEVVALAGPKGNLQFPLDKPMPLDLIRRIVRYRVKEAGGQSNTKKHRTDSSARP